MFNFTDACSIALLRFLDFDDAFWTQTPDKSAILINMKSKRNRDKFIKRVEDVVLETTSFGSQLLLCYSCHPSKNWRIKSQTIPLIKRYDISDESVMICPPFLESAIEAAWNNIKPSNQVKKVEVSELDFRDMKKLLVESIGEPFVKLVTADIKLITETNELFIHSGLQEDIPSYFNTTIDNLLLKLNIN